MPWFRKEIPLIPGYELLGDTVTAKSWLNFKISQLLDSGYPLWEYRSILKTREDICNFVISQFDYPMARGVPTDKHYNNWFDSNCCHQITQDYWQQASETLRTLRLNQRSGKKGFGDCEDVSCLFVTLFLMKGWQAWECLGLVLQDGQVLGGHGWSLFPDGLKHWRLYEATLSTPPIYPGGYPITDPDATEWKVGDVTYQCFAKFKRKEYFESSEVDMFTKYLNLKLGAKETRKKYEAIATAWKQKTKPLVKLGLLSKLRWRQ